VLVLCGLDPFVAAGQWISDLIASVCAASDASGQAPGDAPARLSWQEVVAAAPDVLVLSPCSRAPENARREALALSGCPSWWQLPAVAAGRVYIADHSFLSTPGPRMATAGAELVARLVWGDAAAGLPPCPEGAVLRLQPPPEIVSNAAAAAVVGAAAADARLSAPMQPEWFVPWR
jgi:iron complex transport system substrate-binding protein